ncbi:MAG: hypothetical protein Q8Q94_00750 [bacterium]|nr:hypothetical protein [bacterium]MDZ4299329.1 hypothetical protein [Candidatus Sungbacteria bacterium]
MKLSSARLPEWSLRLGLAATYLYSGLDLVRHPTAWYWALRPLPDFFQSIIHTVGTDRYLRLQGASELVFAAVFLAWFLPLKIVRIVAALTALEMLAILLMVGTNGETFRDIGILGAAAGLFFLIKKTTNAMPSM